MRAWYQKNKEHTREYRRKYRSQHPEKFVRYDRYGHVYKQYGLNKDEYLKLEQVHDGKCALCNKTSKLYVDHNHETGVVRGLLCPRCNVGLSFIEDAKFGMLAQDYLRGSSQ